MRPKASDLLNVHCFLPRMKYPARTLCHIMLVSFGKIVQWSITFPIVGDDGSTRLENKISAEQNDLTYFYELSNDWDKAEGIATILWTTNEEHAVSTSFGTTYQPDLAYAVFTIAIFQATGEQGLINFNDATIPGFSILLLNTTQSLFQFFVSLFEINYQGHHTTHLSAHFPNTVQPFFGFFW